MECLVADRLWTDFAPSNVAGIAMGRRMTVARAENDQVVVWSPLPASSKAVADLKGLSDSPTFILQSKMHDRYIGDYLSHFPDSVFLAAPGPRQEHADWPLQELHPEHESLTGIQYLEIKGMPKVQEQVFFHEETKTLIIADLFFNLERPRNLLSRMLYSMADLGGKPRPSRLWRAMIADADAFSGSIREVLNWEIERIIPGHGQCIHTRGKEVLSEAFASWLGKGAVNR